MKELLHGRKMLLLGANMESIPIVKKAQEMGVFVIVTDNIPNSPAKKIADQHYDVDGKDIKKLEMIIGTENVDGILVGSADPLVPAYCELCERRGLPCYIEKEHLSFFTNKQEFKKWMKTEDIPVIEEYYVGESLEGIDESDFKFPIIVKPEIGRGGAGVSLCLERKHLKETFETAKRNSDNGRVIIEAYMDSSEVTVNYVFSNGMPKLMVLSDRLSLREAGKISPVTYGNYYPSIHTDKFIKEYHPMFCRLFRKMGIQQGIIEMQMFVKEGEFYPYDPSCILGGEFSGSVFSKVLKAELIEHLIIYALTGKRPEYTVDTEEGYLPHNKYAASVWLLLLPGTIKKICGIDKVKKNKNVIGDIWRLKEGDTVTEEQFQTEKSTLARLWVSADSKEELESSITEIRTSVKVYDKDGNNMLYEHFEVEEKYDRLV